MDPFRHDTQMVLCSKQFMNATRISSNNFQEFNSWIFKMFDSQKKNPFFCFYFHSSSSSAFVRYFPTLNETYSRFTNYAYDKLNQTQLASLKYERFKFVLAKCGKFTSLIRNLEKEELKIHATAHLAVSNDTDSIRFDLSTVCSECGLSFICCQWLKPSRQFHIWFALSSLFSYHDNNAMLLLCFK